MFQYRQVLVRLRAGDSVREIARAGLMGRNKLAQVQIKMSWYLDSEGTLKETSAVQTWEKHGKTWWVIEEKRLRGKEMPGLREDPSDKGPQASTAGEAIEQ